MLAKEWDKFINLIPRLRKKIHETARRNKKDKAAALRLTPTQLDTLYTIATRSEWRMSDLSRRLQVSAGSLTTMINRLIEAGVVERERCQQDRRVVIVKLNAAGEALVQAKRQEFLQNLQLLMADLSEADRAQLAEALGTVVDILNKIV